MNEPKRRGRPTNAEREAKAALLQSAHSHNGDREYFPEPAPTLAPTPAPIDDSRERAQALALRIWSGQSSDLGVGDRKERIRIALEAQGLSMDGVKLPVGQRDDSDWTAEDEAPIVWRTQRTA